MGILKLKSINVRGLRSFGSEVTISFPEHGNMLIDGKNIDTGGSSGSGKSSIAMAIAYAFGYCDIPATQLQSWSGMGQGDTLQVEVVFETNQGLATLVRGPKVLSLTVAGTKTKGSAAAVEAKLRELTGLSPDMLAALTYRAQKTPGLFLNKTDSEKKEFLTALLGLEKYEEAVEQAQENIKSLETEMQVTSQLATKLTDVVQSTLNIPAPPLPDTNTAQDEQRCHELTNYLNVVARPNLKSAEQELRELRDSNQAKIASILARHFVWIQDAKTKAIPFQDDSVVTQKDNLRREATQRREALEQKDNELRLEQMKKAQAVKAELTKADISLEPIERRIAALENQIALLAKNICFECGQTRLDALERQKQLQIELGDSRAELVELREVKATVPDLKAQYDALLVFTVNPMVLKLKEVENQLRAEVASLEAKLNAETQAAKLALEQGVKDAIAALDAEQNAARIGFLQAEGRLSDDVSKAQSEVNRLEAEIGRINDSISHNKKMLAAYSREVARRDEDKKRLKDELAVAVAAAKVMEEKLSAEKDFIKLVGREGFLGAIFDECLAEISDEANRILGRLPNAAHVAVRFVSEVTTQKGTAKRAIVPVISINGHEAPIKSGCSGGMMTSVELAVDLAVATVVSRRTGSMPGWLILDESFDGLDLVTKESCMELLSQYAADKLVMVVDHASEFKEAFTHIVTVVHENGQSRIQ